MIQKHEDRSYHLHITISRRALVWGVIALVVCAGAYQAFSETLTMTTYYPSPAGVYKRLVTTAQTLLARDNGNVGIGTTTPKSPSPKNNVNKGNLDVYDIYLRSVNQWLVGDGVAGVPQSAVLAFNAPACPAGWSPFVPAQGRYVVGLPAGGSLGGTAGQALANLENRAAGPHQHGLTQSGMNLRALAFSNGITCDYYCPGNLGYGSARSGIVDFPATNSGPAGLPVGTNAPYVQLLMCQKD